MHEQVYMQELARCLSALGEAEREEILEDYRQHFRDGRAGGLSDEAIIAQLGSPAEAAAEYLEAAPEVPASPPTAAKKPWAWIAGVVVLAVACIVTLAFALRPVPTFPFPVDPDEIKNLGSYVKDITDAVMDGLDGFSQIDWGQWADQDWSYWTSNQPSAEMKPASSTQTYENVREIAVVGSYRMSCTVETDPDLNGVRVEVSGELPTSHRLDVTQSGQRLTLRYEDANTHVNIPERSRLDVTLIVPENWGGLMDLATVSGTIQIDDDVISGSLSANTVSGRVSVSGAHQNIAVNTVSGKVDVDLSEQPAWIEDTTIEVCTTSGAVAFSAPKPPKAVALSTISGAIQVRLDGEFRFSKGTVTGRFSNSSQGVEVENSELDFSTVSGVIQVEPYTD